jgi:hypothetical protein
MVGSFGGNDSRPFRRNRVFANSQQSSAQCAGCAIAMLIIPISRRGRLRLLCLQRNLAQERCNHAQENLNLSLTTTMNEPLIGLVVPLISMLSPVWQCPVDESDTDRARSRECGCKSAP